MAGGEGRSWLRMGLDLRVPWKDYKSPVGEFPRAVLGVQHENISE